MANFNQGYVKIVGKNLLKINMICLINLLIYSLFHFAAEYELRCMRNALDMGENEEIVDIAKRFFRVCLLVIIKLHCC